MCGLCVVGEGKQYDAILITDDVDYRGLEVKVATYNKKIYNAYKNAVKLIVGLRSAKLN